MKTWEASSTTWTRMVTRGGGEGSGMERSSWGGEGRGEGGGSAAQRGVEEGRGGARALASAREDPRPDLGRRGGVHVFRAALAVLGLCVSARLGLHARQERVARDRVGLLPASPGSRRGRSRAGQLFSEQRLPPCASPLSLPWPALPPSPGGGERAPGAHSPLLVAAFGSAPDLLGTGTAAGAVRGDVAAGAEPALEALLEHGSLSCRWEALGRRGGRRRPP